MPNGRARWLVAATPRPFGMGARACGCAGPRRGRDLPVS